MVTLIIFTGLMLLAFMHGYFIADRLNYQEKRANWMKNWHGLSFIIRALVMAGYFFSTYHLFNSLLFIIAGWHLYDIIINRLNGWPAFYIGKTSETEKKYGKLIWLGKAAVLIAFIITIF